MVLDTSAVLAYLFEEAGAEAVSVVLEAASGLIGLRGKPRPSGRGG